MQEREQRLEALGYALGEVPAPAATYQPLVVDGCTGYLSGALPFEAPGRLAYRGSVPSEVDVTAAQRAAALSAANLLRVLHRELGTLERIERVVRLAGYVRSDSGFDEQHLVVNGASQLLIDVFGDAGRHARSALGVAGLPLGASVELDLIVRIKQP